MQPCSRSVKHDHLPGNRGLFNARAIETARRSRDAIYLTEGSFDALALIAAGVEHAVGAYGLHGIRWEWFEGCRKVILALDNDESGRRESEKMAKAAAAVVPFVSRLPERSYGGFKDVNEAWAAGVLRV